MFDGWFLLKISLDFLPFSQLGIRDFFFWIFCYKDNAILHLQFFLSCAKVFRSHLEENGPGFCRGLAKGRTKVLGTPGAESPRIPGTE